MDVPLQPATPANHRIPFANAPATVRRALERKLGCKVAHAHDLRGGYSPAIAARLTLGDGRRVFFKAIDATTNPDTPRMCRDEARIAAALPDSAPAPRLLAHMEIDGWFALIFEHLDGRMPGQPWTSADLAAALATVDGQAQSMRGLNIPLPRLEERLATAFSAWGRLARTPPAGLDFWSRRHAATLATWETHFPAAVHGEQPLHCDVRSDNLIVTRDGRALLVDWPHLSRGRVWFDVVAMAPSVALEGGPSPERFIAMSRSCATAAPDDVTAAVVALAGYFTEHAMAPPPPGLPTLRSWQALQGEISRQWAADLLGLA